LSWNQLHSSGRHFSVTAGFANDAVSIAGARPRALNRFLLNITTTLKGKGGQMFSPSLIQII
jgi:hypothetical protein